MPPDVTRSLLLDVLTRPASGERLPPAEWDRLVRTARRANLLPRLALLVEREPWSAALPAKIRDHLDAARPAADHHQRTIRWEVNRIQEALRRVGTKLVLLKGAAYVMAGLPAADGRTAADVDALVPREDLGAVEAALRASGWVPVALEPYDERFYREWSHELPPLQHQRRKTVVDVHHTILPPTGRLHPDPAELLGWAVPIEGSRRLWTLAPTDMCLHAAAHLFQDGELAGAVRDLIDQDALLRDFAERVPGFWEKLVPRARQLGLERPLFYALRYARLFLRTPIPAEVCREVEMSGPPAPVLRLMDRLVERALLPASGQEAGPGDEAARLLLYIRSHWLRMPPGALTAHLMRKTARRWTRPAEA
jgi:hypothetical protein